MIMPSVQTVSDPRCIIETPDVLALISAFSRRFQPNFAFLNRWRDEVLLAYGHHHINTRIKMRTALREVIALAGDGEVGTTELLTPALVDRFAARPGRASSTNGLLGSLRCAFKIASTRGYVGPELVPACRFHVLDRDARRGKHHSRESIARALEYLSLRSSDWSSRRLFVVAAVLAYCGLRSSEAKRLRVADVDLVNGFVFVHPNGGRLKTAGAEAPVPMPDALAAILREWIPDCGSEWLLPTKGRDKPWVSGGSHHRAGDQLRDVAAAIGVSGFTPISLRRSLATHLIGSHGLTRGQLRLVLRHTSERTQDYYVQRDLDTLRDLVRSFTFAPRPGTPAT